MVSCDYDLRFLKEGVDQFEKYLLSEIIYYPLNLQAAVGETPYPQLTLGWLLFFRKRAGSTCKQDDIGVDKERINQKIDFIRSKWLTAWRKKARAEFHARLFLWRDYLEEYQTNPGDNYNRYGYEVNRRVLLQLLRDEVADFPESDLQLFNALDLILHAMFIPGVFVWDDTIASSFPKSNFWYLYGSLSREAKTSVQ